MIQLRPHQIEAVEQLSNGKVLWGGTGTGKTLTALAYYVKNESPKNIYVITTARKRDSLDWEKEASSLGVGEKRDGTLHGCLTVDSWNNIAKYADVRDCFFIFDEQRAVGNGTWVKTFIKLARANNWILLSATPGDTWIDYIPLFVANNLYKNSAEFKREHVVYETWTKYPKIRKFLDVRTLEKYKNMILVEMPYETHTTRHSEDMICEYDVDLYNKTFKTRWNPYTDEPIVDAGELCWVLRRIVASDPSRVIALMDLLKDHPKMIVFYNFNYELDILRGLGEGIEIAEWNGHRKQEIPKSDSWLYLVQYVAGAEGWNCVETDAMAFYSMTYSFKNYHQAHGRIDRLNTPFTDLYYYTLRSNAKIDLAVQDSLTNKKHFNEKNWYENLMLLVPDALENKYQGQDKS